jgi:hypothetical protein
MTSEGSFDRGRHRSGSIRRWQIERELDQGERITGRQLDQPSFRLRGDWPSAPEQLGGGWIGERFELDELAAVLGRGLATSRHYEAEPDGVSPPRHEVDDLAGRAVEPVVVIDQQQDWLLLRGEPEKVSRCSVDSQTIPVSCLREEEG